jgi:hypothetical protein
MFRSLVISKIIVFSDPILVSQPFFLEHHSILSAGRLSHFSAGAYPIHTKHITEALCFRIQSLQIPDANLITARQPLITIISSM